MEFLTTDFQSFQICRNRIFSSKVQLCLSKLVCKHAFTCVTRSWKSYFDVIHLHELFIQFSSIELKPSTIKHCVLITIYDMIYS